MRFVLQLHQIIGRRILSLSLLLLLLIIGTSTSFTTTTTTANTAAMTEECDVLIVGGGIVGLAVLRAATLKGYKCILIEKEPDLLHWASGSNSGIACTGVDASPGTLERALIRDSVSQIRYFCKEMNIPTRPCGSLVCQWTWNDACDSSSSSSSSNFSDRLQHVLDESHLAGDTHAAMLTPTQVAELEPNLNNEYCQGAVHIPGEIVVDPWLYSIAFAVHARENGARIYTNFAFDPALASFDNDDDIWTVRRPSPGDDDDTAESITPLEIKAKLIVSATGLWSDTIQKAVHESSQWSAQPRRGQYLVFNANSQTSITHPIQPVPTQFTKGIFIFSTVYNQIVVGPTALDQESKTDRNIDPQVSKDLAGYVKKIIPHIDLDRDLVGSYVGIRPGTNLRDYQIHTNFRKKWITAAGIRSTGLTASLGIGRHVVSLIDSVSNDEDRTLASECMHTTPLPSVSDLAAQYQSSKEGFVVIHGHRYRVTHPTTKYGWTAEIK